MNFTPGWHVLYVRANHEQKITDLLQFEQLDSFLPKIKKFRKYKNCKKVIFSPLFPSYVFVKIESRLDLYKALSLKSSCSFLKTREKYALITEEEIIRIKLLSKIDGLKEIELDSKPIKIGETKLLTVGPFEGIECEIMNVKNKNKIIVRIKSIRQNITAIVPLKYITNANQELNISDINATACLP
jgi:transcriptional antiterminator RfaH